MWCARLQEPLNKNIIETESSLVPPKLNKMNIQSQAVVKFLHVVLQNFMLSYSCSAVSEVKLMNRQACYKPKDIFSGKLFALSQILWFVLRSSGISPKTAEQKLR